MMMTGPSDKSERGSAWTSTRWLTSQEADLNEHEMEIDKRSVNKFGEDCADDFVSPVMTLHYR